MKTSSSNTVPFIIVVLDNDGKSRGYGFVRFKDETDQQRALIDMQHFTGLGKKPNTFVSKVPPVLARKTEKIV